MNRITKDKSEFTGNAKCYSTYMAMLKEVHNYYESNFENIMIEKIDNRIQLTENDYLEMLKKCTISGSTKIDCSSLMPLKYFNYISIVKLCDRFFRITYEIVGSHENKTYVITDFREVERKVKHKVYFE